MELKHFLPMNDGDGELSYSLNSSVQEVFSNGRMLLTYRGRPSLSDSKTWQPWEQKIFTKAIFCLVSEGMIKEEKLDIPNYFACEEEFESIVKKQGSFAIENTKTMAHHVALEIEDKWERSKFIAKFRAFSESLISCNFGEEIWDSLYEKLVHFAFQHLDHGQLAVTSLLKKI